MKVNKREREEKGRGKVIKQRRKDKKKRKVGKVKGGKRRKKGRDDKNNPPPSKLNTGPHKRTISADSFSFHLIFSSSE